MNKDKPTDDRLTEFTRGLAGICGSGSSVSYYGTEFVGSDAELLKYVFNGPNTHDLVNRQYIMLDDEHKINLLCEEMASRMNANIKKDTRNGQVRWQVLFL